VGVHLGEKVTKLSAAEEDPLIGIVGWEAEAPGHERGAQKPTVKRVVVEGRQDLRDGSDRRWLQRLWWATKGGEEGSDLCRVQLSYGHVPESGVDVHPNDAVDLGPIAR
jgi:hypothetical protein